MKKIYFVLAGLLLQASVYAQLIQASIGVGTTANSVRIYLRTPVAYTPTNISTLQFNVGIATSITPAPVVSVRSGTLPGVTWTVEPAVSEGGYNNYAIQTASSPLAFNLVANTDFEVMELAFTGGPVTPQNVSLVTLPGGGLGATQGKALFYCTGTPASVGNNLYYTRAGVTISNLFSYDETNGNNPGTGISTATIGNIALPTKFLSFFAIKNEDAAKLSWTVDNEESNQYFEVETSTDGRNFTTVQRVNALRNGQASNTYNLTDAMISRYRAAIIYYRIRQVEADGKTLYSEIRQLSLNSRNVTVALYPNPVQTVTKLVIDATESGKVTVIVRDATGKTVRQLGLQLLRGINQHNLDATILPAGDYNVSVVGSKLNQTIKLTKSN